MSLLDTIKADLAAGESWFKKDVEPIALEIWNFVKIPLVALGPAEGQIVIDVLKKALQAATDGTKLEDIATAALNMAKEEERAIFSRVGSDSILALIAGLRVVFKLQ